MRLGIHDERTRIVLYLPNNNPAEADAVNDVIDHLKQLRRPPPGKGKVTGFTMTRSIPAAYEGYYWSTRRRRWVLDRLVLIVFDHEFRISEARLHIEVDDLKKTVDQAYRNRGSPQDEIWVITYPIWRYD